ncbi:MAG: nucleotide-diphospho-sugar transferase [Benjaminiella poitrasii]|nr:MAG: nucleotide-diphospho-sugar transferase [Benjaminiella poitrasii]
MIRDLKLNVFNLKSIVSNHDLFRRVEPDVRFSCDVDYDPFKLMRERDLKYGFTISIREYEKTIPTLWDRVKEFADLYPDYIIPFNSSDSFVNWLSDDGGDTYNMCHFWSNFEIGSLKWLRSKEYLAFFNYLDQTGGFFYERWGDAPVHSIAAALFLKKSEVHFFYDMGYFHDPILHCPSEPSWLPIKKCNCDPSNSMDDDRDFSCTAHFLDIVEKRKTDYLITERQPKRDRVF